MRLAAARYSPDGGQGLHLPHRRLYNPALHFNTRETHKLGKKNYRVFKNYPSLRESKIFVGCCVGRGVAHLGVFPWLITPERNREEVHSRPANGVGQRLHEHGLSCPATSRRYHSSIQPPLCACAVWLFSRVHSAYGCRSLITTLLSWDGRSMSSIPCSYYQMNATLLWFVLCSTLL